jgi:hypothetical protein
MNEINKRIKILKMINNQIFKTLRIREKIKISNFNQNKSFNNKMEIKMNREINIKKILNSNKISDKKINLSKEVSTFLLKTLKN